MTIFVRFDSANVLIELILAKYCNRPFEASMISLHSPKKPFELRLGSFLGNFESELVWTLCNPVICILRAASETSEEFQLRLDLHIPPFSQYNLTDHGGRRTRNRPRAGTSRFSLGECGCRDW